MKMISASTIKGNFDIVKYYQITRIHPDAWRDEPEPGFVLIGITRPEYCSLICKKDTEK